MNELRTSNRCPTGTRLEARSSCKFNFYTHYTRGFEITMPPFVAGAKLSRRGVIPLGSVYAAEGSYKLRQGSIWCYLPTVLSYRRPRTYLRLSLLLSYVFRVRVVVVGRYPGRRGSSHLLSSLARLSLHCSYLVTTLVSSAASAHGLCIYDSLITALSEGVETNCPRLLAVSCEVNSLCI